MSLMRKATGLILLLLLLSSCEVIGQFQLFPSNINSTVAQVKISELFGIHKLDEEYSIFDLEYLETNNRSLLVAGSYKAREGYPSIVFLDPEDLSIVWQSNQYMEPRNFTAGLMDEETGNNDIITRGFHMDGDLNYSDIHVQDFDYWFFEQMRGGFMLYQPAVNDSPPYEDRLWFVKDPSRENLTNENVFIGSTSYLSYGHMRYGLNHEGTENVRLYDSSIVGYINFDSNDDPLFACRSINDVTTGISYIVGIIPELGQYAPDDPTLPTEYWETGPEQNIVYKIEYQANGEYGAGNVGPVQTQKINLGTSNGGYIRSWEDDFYYAGLAMHYVYYSRKGWITREEGENNGFAIRDLNSGTLLDKPLVYLPFEQDITFSYDGKYAYYIDPKTMMLVKAETPW